MLDWLDSITICRRSKSDISSLNWDKILRLIDESILPLWNSSWDPASYSWMSLICFLASSRILSALSTITCWLRSLDCQVPAQLEKPLTATSPTVASCTHILLELARVERTAALPPFFGSGLPSGPLAISFSGSVGELRCLLPRGRSGCK